MRPTDKIDDQLAALLAAPPKELQRHWSQLFGSPLPRWKRTDLLIRILAYRLQEKVLGSLKPATSKRLAKLAKSLEWAPDSLDLPYPRIKSGTRFIREWGGDTHSVTATGRGFTYLGKKYRSLSEVARTITGTRWSGPRFFGLKKAQEVHQERRHGRG